MHISPDAPSVQISNEFGEPKRLRPMLELVKNIYRPSRQRVVGSQHLDVQGRGFTRRALDPPDTANISGKQGFLGTSELKGVGRVVVDDTNMLFSQDGLMDMLYGTSSRYSSTSLLRMFLGGLINQNDPTLLLDEQTVIAALAFMLGVGEKLSLIHISEPTNQRGSRMPSSA